MRFYINFCTNVMSGHVMSGLTLLCADLRFGLSPASSPLQSPFCHSCSLLLDFRVPPLRLKVQSTALSRSFCTSSCLPSTSKSNPPLFLAPPRKKGGLQRNPPILIRQSQSASRNQPVQSSISQFHQVKHLQ